MNGRCYNIYCTVQRVVGTLHQMKTFNIIACSEWFRGRLAEHIWLYVVHIAGGDGLMVITWSRLVFVYTSTYVYQ